MPEDPIVLSPPEREMREELERLRLLYHISQEFNSSLELDELLPKVFDTVLSVVGAQGGSIWIAEGDVLRCRIALGSSSQKLVNTTIPLDSGFVGDVVRRQRTTMVSHAMQDPRFDMRTERSSQMVTLTVMATPMITKGETVGSIQLVNKVSDDGIFDDRDRELLEGLAGLAAVALRNAQLHAAEKRASDLALLLEISREITATLDLDRVLQSVVNLAARAFPFDRVAIALVDRDKWEIRAVAGEEAVNPAAPEMKRLAERGAWAADQGTSIYMDDLDSAAGAAQSAFLNAFESEFQEEGLRSIYYLPLKDEEGVLGALLLESRSPNLANPTQSELGEILANQTAVALRNAQLYHRVPMADTIGALAARKRAWLALPRRRKQLYLGIAAVVLAAITLIQWPFRVPANDATIRAFPLTEVRSLVPGVIERVLVREGDRVVQGAPVAKLRNNTLEATRASRFAEAMTAERTAALAASQGDAAEERQQRARLTNLQSEIALLDRDIEALTVRAPTEGTVLTPRTEERTGLRLEAGEPVMTVGRTDSVTLEFTVDQRELNYLVVGQTVRLRLDALPDRTFEGRLIFLGELPSESNRSDETQFPARAVIVNSDGALRTGMSAQARVLTEPMSILGRLTRGPIRWIRLAWWRLMP
jgi:GAF domain-containing protein/multidrug resistance efflux pump